MKKFYYIPGIAKQYTASRRGFNAAITKASLVGTRVMCHNADGTEELVWQAPHTCPKCGCTS